MGKSPKIKRDIFLILFVSASLILIWFWRGLLFATGEESLSFYNPTRSFKLFSYLWYEYGTGHESFLMIARSPYFAITSFFFKLGLSAVFLQALTFLIIILLGTLSVYFLMRALVAKNTVPLLAAVFYLLNPFSTSQVWGRALSFQIFAFGLIPFLLLMYVLSLKKRNIIYCLLGVIVSYFLSVTYSNPALVVTSWIPTGLYFLYYLVKNHKQKKEIILAIAYFLFYIMGWILINFFWIYPFLVYGGRILSFNLGWGDNSLSLKGVSVSNGFWTVIRLMHWEFMGDHYGTFYQIFFAKAATWLIPFVALFSLVKFKKLKNFSFFALFFLIAIFISIGDNSPTGPLLVWILENVPMLQVLRNPYEKNGINLMLAYAPFFAVGVVSLAKNRLQIILLVFTVFVVLAWPMWRGNFSGGIKSNSWVDVPEYYKNANDWLNQQNGDFRILQLPLLPEDGVNYKWENPYQGIEPSEFLFDRHSISRYNYFFRNYYAVLQERFSITRDVSYQKKYGIESKDFRSESLAWELAKLNVKYIILNYDTDYEARGAASQETTKKYLEAQEEIKKVNTFGQLDIYEVDLPPKIALIYSPDADVEYKEVNTTNYEITIKNAKENINLIFLNTFDSGWKLTDGEKEVGNHSEIFSYANSWKLERSGDYRLNLKFEPQESFYLGSGVSLVSLAVFSLLVLFRKYSRV